MRLIHQCTVRRDVVIELIETMKQRGHRAYTHVDMDEVRRNAKFLPVKDVPPEIIRFLKLDDLQDKIQPQKSATPVPVARSMEEALQNVNMVKPNAVVNENSSQSEFDVLHSF